MVWQGVVLGTVFGKVRPGKKPYQEDVRKLWSWYGAIIFQTFTNVVWQGIVLGTIFGKMSPMKNLIRNMLKSDGPDEGPSFPQLLTTWFGNGLTLWSFLEKWGQGENPIRNMWNNDGPDRGNHFFNFYKYGWAGDCLGDHFGKKRDQGETLSEICWKVMVLMRAIIFQTFNNMVWQWIIFGTIWKSVTPKKNRSRNIWKSDGPVRGHNFVNFHQHDLARTRLGDILDQVRPCNFL